MTDVALVPPALAFLPSYADALRRGWSRDNVRPELTAREDLAAIASDAEAFVASLDDREARGAPIRLPDGTTRERLPGFNRWISDGEFCGSIGIRWQPGTTSLPPHVLGHIGFSVVPWKRGGGCATKALALLLPVARDIGLDHVDLTTDPENLASQKVILANGGVLVERFRKETAYGGIEALRFRIPLASKSACS